MGQAERWLSRLTGSGTTLASVVTAVPVAVLGAAAVGRRTGGTPATGADG